MSEASFTVQVVDDVPVVVTPEDIDITNADELRAILLEASASAKLPARADGAPVIADMSGTQFCDSSGVNVLVREHQRAESDGGALLLAGLSEPVRRIFAVTGDHPGSTSH